MSFDELIVNVSRAIGRAEGFGIPNARPTRNHNPGNLTEDLIGKAVGMDGTFVQFANDADGWQNLFQQVRLMFAGSQIYNPAMSILDIANRYTRTEIDAWAQNVADALGVDVNTTLNELKSAWVTISEEGISGSTTILVLLVLLAAWWGTR